MNDIQIAQITGAILAGYFLCFFRMYNMNQEIKELKLKNRNSEKKE